MLRLIRALLSLHLTLGYLPPNQSERQEAQNDLIGLITRADQGLSPAASTFVEHVESFVQSARCMSAYTTANVLFLR